MYCSFYICNEVLRLLGDKMNQFYCALEARKTKIKRCRFAPRIAHKFDYSEGATVVARWVSFDACFHSLHEPTLVN
jgi:hypothetical protein